MYHWNQPRGSSAGSQPLARHSDSGLRDLTPMRLIDESGARGESLPAASAGVKNSRGNSSAESLQYLPCWVINKYKRKGGRKRGGSPSLL